MALTSRVVLSLTLNEGQLCRTKRFRPDRWYSLNFVDMELADEILLLNVSRPNTEGNRLQFLSRVCHFSNELFLPLTVGGHITSMDDVKAAFACGADKIVVNTHAFRHPGFITEIAHKWGNQAVVVSIDVRNWHVWIDRGSGDTGVHVLDWAREAVSRGAGELLLMDMDRDGSLEGYNLELLETVSRAVSVPVVAVGGCGRWEHLAEGFKAGADACATACIFHFTRPSLEAAKAYLGGQGLEVRV